MRKQELLVRDIRKYHIPISWLAKKMHMSRSTLYAKLGIDGSPMFFADCNRAIGSILHEQRVEYAKKEQDFSKER